MAEPRTAERAQQDEGHPSGDERFALLDKTLRRVRYQQDQLIEVLHVAQDLFGHLSEDILLYLARQLKLPPSRVYGVATFYHLFTFSASGEHAATVCMGTACFVKGAEGIVAELEQAYGVQPGSTTEDGQLTVTTARCVGSCGLAPVVVVDGVVTSHQTPESTLERVGEMLEREPTEAST
ncbi:MAG: bidirectional hydrogenase complex protein HoxE [Actinomycetota bacterium]